MAIVVHKTLFGGGVYSTTHNNRHRMVGQRTVKVSAIQIDPTRKRVKRDGYIVAGVHPPFMPKKVTDNFHPGGNSLCFTIQLAHLMGCDPIYAMGFTLQSGTPYFFGRGNPGRRGEPPSYYDLEAPMHWLEWYESQYPGRVKLVPGWDGPVYSVFQTEDPKVVIKD